MSDPQHQSGSVTRECPFNGCGWEVTVEKDYPEDEYAIGDAEHRAEKHYHREHCGKAKVRVVLEREVTVQPGDDLQSVVDRNHDSVDEDEPLGWEVAWAYGEYLEEPTGDRQKADSE